MDRVYYNKKYTDINLIATDKLEKYLEYLESIFKYTLGLNRLSIKFDIQKIKKELKKR